MTKLHSLYRQYNHTPSETAKQMWFYVRACGWFQCTPQFRVYRQALHDFMLGYVVRGCGRARVHGRDIALAPGQAFLFDLSREHAYSPAEGEPWEFAWVHFGGVAAADHFLLLAAEEQPVFTPERPDRLEGLFRQLVDLFGVRPLGLEPIAHSLVNQILTGLVVDKMRQGRLPASLHTAYYPEPVRQGIGYLEANFHEPLQLHDIAREVTLSPFHFSRMFKRSTGVSVMEYLIRFRLNQAKYLLGATDLSIREIAEQSGFADQSYFGKVFKRYERVTPSEFRIQNRRES